MGEYINADAFMRSIRNIRDMQDFKADTNWYSAYDEFLDLIEDFPTADVIERKRGRWIDSVEGGQENRSAIRIIMELPSAERKRGEWVHYDECDFDYDYKCSLCGYAVWDNSDYCPGCGADMRSKENE